MSSIFQNNKLQAEHQNPELAADIIRAWKSDASLRAEFGNNLTRYASYRQAEAAGRFKVVAAGAGLHRLNAAHRPDQL